MDTIKEMIGPEVEHAKVFFRNALMQTMDITAEELQPLIDVAQLVSCKKGQVIINQGEVSQYIYFICKGVMGKFKNRHRLGRQTREPPILLINRS